MKNSGRNIEFKYILSANIAYIKFVLSIFNSFRKSYKNSFFIFLKFLKNQYPLVIKLKNNETINIKNSNALVTIPKIIENKGIEYDYRENIVEIFSPIINSKNKIKIFGGIENGDIENVFIKKDYHILPIENKTVLDIGANIGDSSIYFAINGAKKVLGFEPFTNNYEFAIKNISENNMAKIIKIVHGAVADFDHEITIEENTKGNVDSKIKQTEHGEQISVYSLKTIIEKFEIPQNSILKIDCEGCEYDLILSSSIDTLRKFSWILIEYHHGYENIVEKLEKCNFKVNTSRPMSTGFMGEFLKKIKNKSNSENINPEIQFSKFGYVGLILAKKID